MDPQGRYYEDKLSYEIDSWDLKVGLEAGENIIIIDARTTEAYARGHIPGAINHPHRQMDAATTESLDKAALIVPYCDGIGCNASTKAAAKLHALGFRVKELLGGLDWWIRDGHPTAGDASETDGSCGCG